MITDVVLFNGWHLGDVLFSQAIVRNFCETNPHIRFKYAIHYGWVLYKDIPNLEVVGFCQEWAGLYSSYNCFHLLNDTTLALNLWVFGIAAMNGPNWGLCHQLEVRMFKMQEQLVKNLEHICPKFQIDLHLQPLTKTQLLPKLPETDISQFLEWRRQRHHQERLLFYSNYSAKSGQSLGVHDHDEVIVQLSKRYPSYSILVPDATESLLHVIQSNHLLNVVIASSVFGCVRSEPDCEHLCKLAMIFQQCDYGIIFDVGACLFFLNTNLCQSKVNVFHVATTDILFHALQENMEDDYLAFCKKHYHFVKSNCNQEFLQQLPNMIS